MRLNFRILVCDLFRISHIGFRTLISRLKDLMDTKRMITGMVLAMAVILGYQMFVTWLWKHNNWKPPGAGCRNDTDQHRRRRTADHVQRRASGASMIGAATTGPTTQAAGVHVVGDPPFNPRRSARLQRMIQPMSWAFICSAGRGDRFSGAESIQAEGGSAGSIYL